MVIIQQIDKGEESDDHYLCSKFEFKYETKALLQFDEGEEDFQTHISRLRLSHKDLVPLDARIFIIVAGVMALAPKRMANAGHESENPAIFVALAYYIALVVLYCYQGKNATLRERLSSLRVPIQFSGYTIAVVLFARHSGLPQLSNVCSVLWPGGVAIEALAAYLIWLAMFPILAALPLKIALIMEIGTSVLLSFNNPVQCQLDAVDCKDAYGPYIFLQRAAAISANALPFGVPLGEADLGKEISCLTISAFLKLSINIVFFFYMTYRHEVNSREAYALERNRLSLTQELRWRKPLLWQTIGEALFALILTWNVCVLGSQWYLYILKH